MARRLSSVLVLFAALTCAALAATWVVSHRRGTIPVLLNSRFGTARFLVIGGNAVFFVTAEVNQPPNLCWTGHLGDYGRVEVRSQGETVADISTNGFLPPRGALGFAAFHVRGPSVIFTIPGGGGYANCTVAYRGVGAPFWFLLALATAVPAAAAARGFWRRRLARRIRLGLCAACGYDLRASTDRCPECGNALTPVRADA